VPRTARAPQRCRPAGDGRELDLAAPGINGAVRPGVMPPIGVVPQRRRPRMAAIAVAAETVALGVLLVAVARQLVANPTGSVSMALTRGGVDDSALRPLFGPRLLTAWQLAPIALVLLVLAAGTYLRRSARVEVLTGVSWPWWRTVSFLTGLLACAFATCGSIAVYDMRLFTAHMLGHLMFVMIAPACLATGQPLGLLLATSTTSRRRRLERALRSPLLSAVTSPPIALASYAVVIVGSHLTGLMIVVMSNTWAGQAEHLVYVLVGYQFFALVVGGEPLRWQLSMFARQLLLATAMAIDTLTGITLLQMSSPVGIHLTPSLHTNALSDTHTGGAIMWALGDGIMAVIMVLIVIAWSHRTEVEQRAPHSWVEQARRAAFTGQTGNLADATNEAGTYVDDDEQRHRQYNAWLAALNQKPDLLWPVG